jgi:branched-chain amino acid transport system permease protein
VLVLLILNFKPSGLLGEWELTPRNMQQLFAKLGKKNTAKKEG